MDTLRSDVATVPVHGFAASRVVVATVTGDPNPLLAEFVQAAHECLVGQAA